MVPHVAGQKRRTNGAAIDPVAVGFRAGGFAGVKLERHHTYFEHADGGGQNIIQGLHQILSRNRRFERAGGYLAEGVDTGVGAPRTLRQDLFTGDSSNSRGQCALDGGGIGLHLPTCKVGAVISENDLKVAHGGAAWFSPRSADQPMQVPAVSRRCAGWMRMNPAPVSYTIAFRQRLHSRAQFARDPKS